MTPFNFLTALADNVDVTSAEAYALTTHPIAIHAGLRNITRDEERALQDQAYDDYIDDASERIATPLSAKARPGYRTQASIRRAARR